ncbi:MAG: adenosylcobinamide-GDP ribazoletransferase [Actinomycetota bacterium]
MSGVPPVAPLAAAQFLTRLPIRLRAAPDLARSVPWFPVVGALIGVFVGAIAAVGAELVPMPVAAALAVLAGIALTGAFHEDGLADTADALGGWTPEQRREILKDSRHGSYGVAAMSGTILLRVVCLASLGPAAAFAGSVAAHTLGRTAAVGVMAAAPPPAPSGLGADHVRDLSRPAGWLGVVAGVVIAFVATGWWAGPLALAALVAAVLVARLAVRAFGGVGGDHLGAIEQVAECLVLVVVAGLATRHDLWWT